MFRAMMLLLALTLAPSVALAQQPCTPDARQVVNELYRHILERGADAGSNVWVQHFQRGGTVRDVVRAIVTSDEHQQRFWRQESGEDTPYLRAVGTLYRHILGRQPDDAGARAWATQASRNSASSSSIADRIMSSAEYTNNFGDWGVPGSGGLRYCGPGNQTASQAPVAATPVNQRRFRGMDRNNDGVISRGEWRGSRQSFEIHDWDNDGVLSGAEVNEAVARQGRTVEDENFDRVDSFENLDVNNNNRIEPREWHGTVAAFNRLDSNNDNFLSRGEFTSTGFDDSAVATSGDFIRVEGTQPWTDTGINIRAGDTITFDGQGTVRISNNRNDIAGVGGTLSGRREANAPLPNQVAGALIARIGNSPPLFIGNRRSVRAPFGGRLYLGVNDDYLDDNSGDFQVTVTVEPR